jgi:hypothetical protein
MTDKNIEDCTYILQDNADKGVERYSEEINDSAPGLLRNYIFMTEGQNNPTQRLKRQKLTRLNHPPCEML